MPVTGNRTSTNIVSCQLIITIVIREMIMIGGFLKNMSSELIMDASTSETSPVMRAMISPFFSSVKKPIGRLTVFL
jgi:hypothetical protein